MSDRYGSISINQENPSAQKPKPALRQPFPKKKKPSGGNRGILLAILATIIITSYVLSALYLAPLAIQRYLPQYIKKTAGLSVSMGQVELNPLNFQVTFSDITADIPESTNEQALLQIPSLFVDIDLTSLLRNSFVCDTLTITGMKLNIIRSRDSSYNIPVLSRLAKKENQETIIDFTQLPFLFSFNNIKINNGSILFSDQVTEKTHTVKELNLAIPTLSNFSFQSENYILPHFSAVINNSKVELSGTTTPPEDGEKAQTKLYCSINELNLIPYFSYLPSTFPMTLSKGMTDLKLVITFSPEKEQGERLSIDVKLTGSDIFLQTKEGDNKISLPKVQLDATLKPLNKLFHIKSLIAGKPQLVTTQKQLSRGLANFLATGSPDTKHLGVSIDLFLFDQGRLVITGKENSIWNSLQLSIKDFGKPDSKSNFHLSGQQAVGTASFSWQGTLAQPRTITGKVLLNEFPASTILGLLHTNPDSSIKGKAEFTGDLTLSAVDRTTTEYSLANATLQLHNLQLSEKDDIWLQADSVRFTRLSRQKKLFTLGNIFLKNASLNLTPGNPPPLFKLLFSDDKRPQILGIDFLGEFTLAQKEDPTQILYFADVTFQANNLGKELASENFTFTAKIGTEGVLKSHGKLALSPTTLQSTIFFSDIDSVLLAPFFSEWPLLQNSEAVLQGEGAFNYPNPSFQGSVDFNEGKLQLEKNTPLLKWDVAELKTIECEFFPFSLQSEILAFQHPQLHFNIGVESPFKELKTSLRKILSSNADTGALFKIHIKKVGFTDATVSLRDTRLTPNWQGTVDELNGYVNNFTTINNGLSSFAMEGIIESGDFSLSGSCSLLQDKNNVRARFTLTEFPLNSFAEQLHDIHLNTENTSINLQSNYTESDSAVDSTTKLNITGLSATSSNNDTALALALLNDSSNSFSQTIHMDNRDRSLFQESLDIFQTNVIKASYAPLLLDQEFGDLQENDVIPFEIGTNSITSAGKEMLIRYSELLSTHPGIALSITGMADANKDRAKLAQTPPPAKPRTIHKEELLELAQERALILYDFFIHSLGITPTRISIDENHSVLEDSPANGAKLSIRAMPPTEVSE